MGHDAQAITERCASFLTVLLLEAQPLVRMQSLL